VSVSSVESQTSPIPSPSESSWFGFAISGQLSLESIIESPSASMIAVSVASSTQDMEIPIHRHKHVNLKKGVLQQKV